MGLSFIFGCNVILASVEDYFEDDPSPVITLDIISLSIVM